MIQVFSYHSSNIFLIHTNSNRKFYFSLFLKHPRNKLCRLFVFFRLLIHLASDHSCFINIFPFHWHPYIFRITFLYDKLFKRLCFPSQKSIFGKYDQFIVFNSKIKCLLIFPQTIYILIISYTFFGMFFLCTDILISK